MTAIEIARRLAELGQEKDACQAYTVALCQEPEPEEKMEAALYILRSGGDYKAAYTCFLELYNQGHFQEDCLSVLTEAFYIPNIKLLKRRYQNNCKLLNKYPYLFRKDFVDFESLPICFYPFDDDCFFPFFAKEQCFGNRINVKEPVVGHNFFHDLEHPILARDVFSQYELEYLNDNVRKSEWVARENHIYLHYADWGIFCAYLQCLNLKDVLESKKIVFLIEKEIEQYPIDFKERFGIDYSQCPLKPVGVQEINKLIWHTQLSTHNGGDFFNEIFDAHPNLLAMASSVMLDSIEEDIQSWRGAIQNTVGLMQLLDGNVQDLHVTVTHKTEDGQEESEMLLKGSVIQELRSLPYLSDKDIIVGILLSKPFATRSLDPASRIVPAVFFQPHFPNIVYELQRDAQGRTMLKSKEYDEAVQSPILCGFKYIKTFTPMRRPTTSHGATVKFMYQYTQEELKEGEALRLMPDAVSQRVLNRSFMIDQENRLYMDSVLVRFEDAKLNPKATFTALAEFLDIPFTESMTYCSLDGEQDPESMAGNVRGFDPATVYRTYDEYVSDAERIYIEYFLQDAYEFYGYDFQYYDGSPMDIDKVKKLLDGFDTIDHYIRETWKKLYEEDRVSITVNGQQVKQDFPNHLLESQVKLIRANRLSNSEILMRGLRFVNKNGQPLCMMPKLKLDPALMEQPLYH